MRDDPSTATSRRASILVAGKRLLRWLFHPAPFLTAVRVTYRRSFQLAAAVFAGSVLVAFLAGPHVPDADGAKDKRRALRPPGMAAAFEKMMRVLDRDQEDAGEIDDPRDAAWKELMAAFAEGDVGEARRILSGLDLNDLLAPRPPHVSDILARTWIGIMVTCIVDTLLCVVLGFILGVYPAVRTAAGGLALGLSLSQGFHAGGGAGAFAGPAWLLPVPVWLILLLASLLSGAVGFDMARYIAQRHKGTWFKEHIRRGLRTWGTAVVPAVLVAMLLLA
ncbi:MAG: hypothetical protein JXP34_01820, partial [Planctomycetes bacterium]|nr:hypothetical protein [Planctomycetota bacterium]